MSRNRKDDLAYLLNIAEGLEKIKIYAAPFSSTEELFAANDQMNLNATLNLLANIGENIKKIGPSLKRRHPEVPWAKIRGLRNRISHDYVNLDMFIIHKIIKEEIDALIAQILAIVTEGLSRGHFDGDDLAAAKDSYYYRHIDFAKITAP